MEGKRQHRFDSQVAAYKEVLLVAAGGVVCGLLGTWFFPLSIERGNITIMAG